MHILGTGRSSLRSIVVIEALTHDTHEIIEVRLHAFAAVVEYCLVWSGNVQICQVHFIKQTWTYILFRIKQYWHYQGFISYIVFMRYLNLSIISSPIDSMFRWSLDTVVLKSIDLFLTCNIFENQGTFWIFDLNNINQYVITERDD